MKSSLLFLLRLNCLLLFTLPAAGQVIISEFMADNKHTLADEDNQFQIGSSFIIPAAQRSAWPVGP
jgi:hypothetical protein